MHPHQDDDRVAHLARRAGDYGVRTGEVSVDLDAVRGRKREIVREWSESSRKGLERHDNLDLIHGIASFTGPKSMKVVSPAGDVSHRLAARKSSATTSP